MKFIQRRAPGMIAGAHDERPEMGEQPLATHEGLLVQGGRIEVPPDGAGIRDAQCV
ncbi:MAG: hypothetical protein WCJ55_03580 [Chloroflexales bacterium]